MSSGLHEKIKNLHRLPSPPATALRLLELANKEDVSLGEVAHALESDPALCAKVLKYANCPLISPRSPVTTVRQAVMLLGIRTVKVTALSFSLVTLRTSARCPSFDYDLFWANAAATATGARGFLVSARSEVRDEAFVAGLISRIGKLALATTQPQEYQRLLRWGRDVIRVGVDEERHELGMDHVEIGTLLLSQWKLPQLLVDAVQAQLNPAAAQDARVRMLAEAVQAGQAVAAVLCGVADASASPVTRELGSAGIAKLQAEFRELASVLSISLKDLPDPQDILERASDLVADLSVETQAENVAMSEEQRTLKARALEDALTGIGNRAAFEQQIRSELARSERFKLPMSVLMIDIDRFKRVNDTHGHNAGDGVLQAVAAALRGELRASDFVARYGGEEFAVIAPQTDAAAAARLCERLRAAVAKCRHVVGGAEFSVTVSVGAAAAIPLPDSQPADFVECADRQLYRAKQGGRDRCFVAEYRADSTTPPAANADEQGRQASAGAMPTPSRSAPT